MRPDFVEWADLARANAARASGWTFEIAGMPAGELRALARSEAIARAREFSARMDVEVRDLADTPELLVMTGHQPEFYHPGVWIKDFLLQRLADETGASAIDLVVDSDGFDTLEMHSPCLRPEVMVCRAYLAVGTSDGCYACTPVPSSEDLERFMEAAAEHLATLPAPALGHHFERFSRRLREAAPLARNIAELVTIARRRFESSAGTDYAELPLTSLSASRSFAAFAVQLGLDAPRFASAYDAALAAYRERTGTRGSAQPFPDLETQGDLVELPLWALDSGRRTVWARTGAHPALVVDGKDECSLEGGAAAAIERVLGCGLQLAPKALALTLYSRLLVADLFIHGVGGGRYDQVTDDVFRRYLGIEPLPFVVASMTMYLPLGARVVRDEEVEQATMALNRLKHNPDQMLDEIEFDSEQEHADAARLAAEKKALVAAIAEIGADKKSIGARIREVNAALAALLEPFERELSDERERLVRMQAASEVLTDRTYPFCYWDPSEIADKAR